jgi:hypothetical protein
VLLALFAAAVPLSGLAHQNLNAGGGGVPVWVSGAFGAAGLVLAWRRPGNALGWIMLAGLLRCGVRGRQLLHGGRLRAQAR